MKFFTLLFGALLGAIVLIGCDRQLLSPLKEVPEPPTNTQFAQMALSDLAETATKHGLMDLANAASDLAAVLRNRGWNISTADFLETYEPCTSSNCLGTSIC